MCEKHINIECPWGLLSSSSIIFQIRSQKNHFLSFVLFCFCFLVCFCLVCLVWFVLVWFGLGWIGLGGVGVGLDLGLG